MANPLGSLAVSGAPLSPATVENLKSKGVFFTIWFKNAAFGVLLADFIDPLFAKVFNYSLLLDSTPTFLILSLAFVPYIYYEINKLKI